MRCRPLGGLPGDGVATHDREVVAVMREVTERKTQEQALETARTDAEKANTAKSHFLATMSHELRTPLNAIIGFSEMMMNETEMRLDADRRREYATLINDSGNHLLSVVNGILDMTKLDTGDFEIRPEPFRLPAVIASCRDLLALKAREAGLELTLDVPADFPEIVADKRALKQILINLLGRTPSSSPTACGTGRDPAPRVDGAWMTLAVEDNGIGIGEEDLPRIGSPFFQARGSYDRRHDGTGLGLSIVKGLAALHGGEVTIRQPDRRGHPHHGAHPGRLRADPALARGHQAHAAPAGRDRHSRGAARHDNRGEEKCVIRPLGENGRRPMTKRHSIVR